MKRLTISVITIICLSILMSACARRPVNVQPSDTNTAYGKYLYNRYNIHYFSKGPTMGASCVNYIGSGMFLPYNTKFLIGEWDQGFTVTPEGSSMVIYFEYSPRYMAGLPLGSYIDLIMSPTPVSYPDLSEMDLRGIQTGKAQTWMTKQGIMVALGYPAKHKTPTLHSDKWIYWKNRVVKMGITFDANDKVIEIR